jgi:hypothetical protein
MKRRYWSTLIFWICLVGLVAASGFYVLMLDRNEKPQASHPVIDISMLLPGSFIEEKLQSSRVFILRDFDAQIVVFVVPFRDGAYWLPEFDWTRPAIPCASFGPDNTDGELDVDGAFRCRLPDYGEFFRREHSWSYAGKNLGYRTADMKIARHEISHDKIVLLE